MPPPARARAHLLAPAGLAAAGLSAIAVAIYNVVVPGRVDLADPYFLPGLAVSLGLPLAAWGAARDTEQGARGLARGLVLAAAGGVGILLAAFAAGISAFALGDALVALGLAQAAWYAVRDGPAAPGLRISLGVAALGGAAYLALSVAFGNPFFVAATLLYAIGYGAAAVGLAAQGGAPAEPAPAPSP